METVRDRTASADRPQHQHAPHPWPDARDAARRAATAAPRPRPADVPLSAALGATLAADVVARVAIPSRDSAAMDGYAVAGPAPWRVAGRALAGRPCPVVRLLPGESVEIATGAPVPEGTEAVLAYEDATRLDGPAGANSAVTGVATPGRHIRRRGEVVPFGTTAAVTGDAVTPALLGLAASLGHDALVVRRPRVHALVTGDEVVAAGIPRTGLARDAIGPMLPGLVSWAGGAVHGFSVIGDGRGVLLSAIRGAAAAGADVVVVCGASSAGPADHLRGVLAEFGAEVLVDGVACRPGHPQLLAALANGTLLVGLPGNPNAALVAAMTVLVPVLTGLADRRDPAHTGRRAVVVGEVHPHHRDTRLVAVRLEGDRAFPCGNDGPAGLRAAARADALAVIPPGSWAGTSELVELPR